MGWHGELLNSALVYGKWVFFLGTPGSRIMEHCVALHNTQRHSRLRLHTGT